jgi:hypothetical protein
MPAAGDIAGLAGALTAVSGAVAQGLITPEQAATLSEALASQMRALEVRERIEARRAVSEAPAIYNRMQLRACVALADGVREIRDEAGEVDDWVRDLGAPILRIDEQALADLAMVPDSLATVLADRAFVAVRPMPPEHQPHPHATAMAPLWAKLSEYLDDHMAWLEEGVEERAAARAAAGDADPIYRSPLFQPGGALFNPDATPA